MIKIGSIWFVKHTQHHKINATDSPEIPVIQISENTKIQLVNNVNNVIKTNHIEKKLIDIDTKVNASVNTAQSSSRTPMLTKSANNANKSDEEVICLHKCTICGLIFQKNENIKIHLKSVHKKDKISGLIHKIIAKKVGNTKIVQSDQVNQIKPIRCYECTICKKMFMYKTNIESHIQNEHHIEINTKRFIKSKLIYPKKPIRAIRVQKITATPKPLATIQSINSNILVPIKDEIDIDETILTQANAEANPDDMINENTTSDNSNSAVKRKKSLGNCDAISNTAKLIKKEQFSDEEDSLICEICNQNVTSDDYVLHVQEMHREHVTNLIYDDTNYNQTIENNNKTNASDNNIENDESYQCLVCGEILPNLFESQNHIDEMHDITDGYKNYVEKYNDLPNESNLLDKTQTNPKAFNEIKKDQNEELSIVIKEEPSTSSNNSLTMISNSTKYKSPHQCEKCKKIMFNLWNAYAHVYVNHKEIIDFRSRVKLYTGDSSMIDYREKYNLGLKDHENMARRYKCIKCDIVISEKTQKAIHARNVHLANDPSTIFEEFQICVNDPIKINENIIACKKPHQCKICNDIHCDLWNAIAHVCVKHKKYPNFESHVKLYEGDVVGFYVRYVPIKNNI